MITLAGRRGPGIAQAAVPGDVIVAIVPPLGSEASIVLCLACPQPRGDLWTPILCINVCSWRLALWRAKRDEEVWFVGGNKFTWSKTIPRWVKMPTGAR